MSQLLFRIARAGDGGGSDGRHARKGERTRVRRVPLHPKICSQHHADKKERNERDAPDMPEPLAGSLSGSGKGSRLADFGFWHCFLSQIAGIQLWSIYILR